MPATSAAQILTLHLVILMRLLGQTLQSPVQCLPDGIYVLSWPPCGWHICHVQGGKCQGEIGPLSSQGASAVHVYTSSFGLIRHSSQQKALI